MPWNKGKKMSEAVIQKNRESHLGQAAWNKGKKMSEAVIQKNRESHLGQSAWNRGKTLPKKTHCKRGHPRLPENIYKNGACKICSLARNILPEEKIRRAIWGKSPAGRVYRNSPQAKSVKV